MLLVIESMTMCFIMLLVCVVGIANGPVGLVTFYEDDVKRRAVELGLTTSKKIRSSTIISAVALFMPVVFLTPYMVYYINGARGFLDIFRQMTIILLALGLFDRVFIDWYWVGHTKAWLIPGTEDLMPYIPPKRMLRKWIATIIGYPAFAAVAAGLMNLHR